MPKAASRAPTERPVIPSASTRLMRAAAAGDSRVVTELLLHANSADINLRSADGFSPLINAAKGGHIDVLRLLLRAGAQVNPPERYSHTALRAAAIFGHADAARTLLDAGADPNHPSTAGKTPLMGACMNGFPRLAKLLLDAGAKVDTANHMHETAAMLAASKWSGSSRDCRPVLRESRELVIARPLEDGLVVPIGCLLLAAAAGILYAVIWRRRHPRHAVQQ